MANDNRENGISRRHALECMAWVGTAVLWKVSGGVPQSLSPLGRAQAAVAIAQTKPTIPVIVKDTTSLYWQTVLAGARKAGQDFGVEIAELGAQSESDADSQITLLEHAVSSNPNPIMGSDCLFCSFLDGGSEPSPPPKTCQNLTLPRKLQRRWILENYRGAKSREKTAARDRDRRRRSNPAISCHSGGVPVAWGHMPELRVLRKARHRRRWASAIRSRPAFVLGPVDIPPWNRQRRFPGTTRMMQGGPALVLALHLGRNLRFKGCPLRDRPRSSSSRHQCRS
jgi:hypothetical protein